MSEPKLQYLPFHRWSPLEPTSSITQDLIDSSARDAVVQRVKSVNPGTKVVPCRHGKVNLNQVLKATKCWCE